ncbi:MAG: succinate dehydrogenase cytochrome b subunit [Deltaproteobacteria bacterium]|nr:succinate dehydrogenase cytochrome b subunit [Deltaproteobacteria bacterium]
MKALLAIVQSNLGQKLIMAATGVALFAFVFQHMIGHLIMFAGADAYNTYAGEMQALRFKWPARLALLVAVALHILAAVSLTRRNRAARPEAYAKNKNTGASLSSRTMIVSGFLLAAFIVYHILHFTIGVTHPEVFALEDRFGRHDVYTGMLRAFEDPRLVAMYLAAMALLCMHLAHGVASFLRTLGLMNERFRKAEERFSVASAALVFIGFASVPLAIVLGILR